MALNEGQKYMSIKLDAAQMLYAAQRAVVAGQDKIDVALFENLDKGNDQKPHYKNQHHALWINEKKSQATDEAKD